MKSHLQMWQSGFRSRPSVAAWRGAVMQRNYLYALFVFTLVGTLDAAQINWTNTAGGNWSVAANWSPNQVPSSTDQVTITNPGNYTINLDVGATVGGLTLGGASGNQSVLINGLNLYLVFNGSSKVGANGLISMFAGSSGGTGNLVVDGVVNLLGGSVFGAGLLDIGPSGAVRGASTRCATASRPLVASTSYGVPCEFKNTSGPQPAR